MLSLINLFMSPLETMLNHKDLVKTFRMNRLNRKLFGFSSECKGKSFDLSSLPKYHIMYYSVMLNAREGSISNRTNNSVPTAQAPEHSEEIVSIQHRDSSAIIMLICNPKILILLFKYKIQIIIFMYNLKIRLRIGLSPISGYFAP